MRQIMLEMNNEVQGRISDLTEIARSFRSAIIQAKMDGRFSSKDRMHRFPCGCCDDSCDLLGFYLNERFTIKTKQCVGRFNDGNPESTTNHVWLVTEDGIIIDITYSQFKYYTDSEEDIHVGIENDFYHCVCDKEVRDNYNVKESERLWNDYQSIIKYL